MSLNTAPQSIAVPELRVERLRFRFVADETMRLPAYSGSAWRGVLGRALRQSVCVTRQPRCAGCLLLTHCVYSTFFESPPASPATAKRYNALPHPFVLEPQIDGRRELQAGAELQLGMTLVGPAGDLKPYLIHALQRAGEYGLDRQRGRLTLIGVEQELSLGSGDWQGIYSVADGILATLRTAPAAPTACPEPLGLRLLTPLRVKRHGRFVGAQQLTPADLLGTLATRVALLAELYQPSTTTLDRAAVNAAIDAVSIAERDLQWYEWTRWSSRQQTCMQLGGLIGTLTLAGAGARALWPLIELGQWLHVGKATSFGLGRYRVECPDHAGTATLPRASAAVVSG
jgi:hypothetical protein